MTIPARATRMGAPKGDGVFENQWGRFGWWSALASKDHQVPWSSQPRVYFHLGVPPLGQRDAAYYPMGSLVGVHGGRTGQEMKLLLNTHGKF